MGLSTLEIQTIARGITAAQMVIRELKPLLDELDVIYNSSGGVSSTLTQPNLDANTSYSGVTIQQIADGFYALTSTLKTGITGAYSQLEQLAARGG